MHTERPMSPLPKKDELYRFVDILIKEKLIDENDFNILN